MIGIENVNIGNMGKNLKNSLIAYKCIVLAHVPNYFFYVEPGIVLSLFLNLEQKSVSCFFFK